MAVCDRGLRVLLPAFFLKALIPALVALAAVLIQSLIAIKIEIAAFLNRNVVLAIFVAVIATNQGPLFIDSAAAILKQMQAFAQKQ